MDAVMFLKEKDRMCGSIMDCEDCPLGSRKTGIEMTCDKFLIGFPEETVAIVERWSIEHPVRTYLSDFLEKHPKAHLIEGDVPIVCCKHLGYRKECIAQGGCEDCWNEPMDEES